MVATTHIEVHTKKEMLFEIFRESDGLTDLEAAKVLGAIAGLKLARKVPQESKDKETH